MENKSKNADLLPAWEPSSSKLSKKQADQAISWAKEMVEQDKIDRNSTPEKESSHE